MMQALPEGASWLVSHHQQELVVVQAVSKELDDVRGEALPQKLYLVEQPSLASLSSSHNYLYCYSLPPGLSQINLEKKNIDFERDF